MLDIDPPERSPHDKKIATSSELGGFGLPSKTVRVEEWDKEEEEQVSVDCRNCPSSQQHDI